MAGDELMSKIRSWLAPPDPWKNYNIGRESRHSETGHGSLTAARSPNGKHLDRVRYSGYTGNVGLPPIPLIFRYN